MKIVDTQNFTRCQSSPNQINVTPGMVRGPKPRSGTSTWAVVWQAKKCDRTYFYPAQLDPLPTWGGFGSIKELG